MHNLKVVTYNMYCRPRLGFWDNQIKRARKLASTIESYEKSNEKIDVLLLQEILDNKVNKIIKKQLKKIGFVFKTHRLNAKFRMNGGVVTYSRHPICTEDKFIFKRANLFNAMAAKGALYSKILKNDTHFHIVNVHLDSFDEKIRTTQMEGIKHFIEEKNIPEDETIIIAGDYNINMHKEEINNVDEVFEYEFADLAKTEDKWSNFTVDKNSNDWIKRRDVNDDEEAEFLDFFIFDSVDVETATMKVLKLEVEQKAHDIIYSTPFFFNFYKPWRNLKVTDLSDHYCVMCDFKY